MKYACRIVMLSFMVLLLFSCNAQTEEIDKDVTISCEKIKDQVLLTIEIDTIPNTLMERYNPYLNDIKNYKPSYPLLILEPDKYTHIKKRTSDNYDTIVPVSNFSGTSSIFPAFSREASKNTSGKRKSVSFLLPAEEASHPAVTHLYTGTTYVINGMPSKALTLYKMAEEELFNSPDSIIGYNLYLRMAELHRLIYSNDSIITSKYRKAIEMYKAQTKHTTLLPILYSQIGSMYIYSLPDSARYYLRKSLAISGSPSPFTQPLNINNYACLMALNNYEGKFQSTLLLWEKTRFYNHNTNITYRVAEAYLGLNQTKEAKEMYDMYGYTWSNIKQYVFLSDYYTTTKEHDKALHYEILENRYTDSVRTSRAFSNMANIENEYNLQQLEIQEQIASDQAQSRLYIIFIAGLTLLLAVISIILIIQKKRKEVEQYNNLVEQLRNENATINNLLESNAEKQRHEDAKLMESLQHRLDTVNKLLSSSYQFIESPDKFIKHFKEAMELDKTTNSNLDDICTIINRKYNNITGRIKEDYPNIKITPDDECLIALICAKYSTMSIAVLFNTTNLGTVYNKKSRLLKKLGIEGPLELFIEEYKKG